MEILLNLVLKLVTMEILLVVMAVMQHVKLKRIHIVQALVQDHVLYAAILLKQL